MRKQTAKWTTRDGRRIRICDLEDQHLLNIIGMLEDRHRELVRQGVFTASLLRGEMALDTVENATEQAEEEGPSYFFPLYDALVEEASCRGLLEC